MLNKSLILLFLICSVVTNPVFAQPVDKVVAAEYAPLMIEGDEDRPGYAIDVFREAAKRAGRDFDLTFLPFQRAMFAVQTDAATLMPALFYGKKRNDMFLWVAEIQSAKLRFATTSERIDSMEVARTVPSVVIEGGTTADTVLTNLGFENLVRVTSPDSSARLLESGRVEAWFQNERAMTDVWQQQGFAEPLVLGDVVHEVAIFLVASPTLPDDVADSYRTAIQSMKADGTLDELWARYARN